MRTAPSLDGLRFRDVSPEHQGDVGDDTHFEYREDPDGIVHAQYRGGAIRLGYLVGTRVGDHLDFRYTHVTSTGETASGRCRSRINVLDDGRVRMHESWEWTSQPGAGTSVIEEVPTGS